MNTFLGWMPRQTEDVVDIEDAQPRGISEQVSFSLLQPGTTTVIRFPLVRPADSGPILTSLYDSLAGGRISRSVGEFTRDPEIRLVTVAGSVRKKWLLSQTRNGGFNTVSTDWFFSTPNDLDWVDWERSGEISELEITLHHAPETPIRITFQSPCAVRTQWYDRRQNNPKVLTGAGALAGAVAAAVTIPRKPAPTLEKMLEALPPEERQKLEAVGGRILAERLRPSAKLPRGSRFFDQIGFSFASVAGAARVPVSAEKDPALATFAKYSLNDRDMVFFSSRVVTPKSIREWIPNKVFPRVALGDESLQSRPEADLAALARMADREWRQGRALIIGYVTIADVEGEQFILVAT